MIQDTQCTRINSFTSFQIRKPLADDGCVGRLLDDRGLNVCNDRRQVLKGLLARCAYFLALLLQLPIVLFTCWKGRHEHLQKPNRVLVNQSNVVVSQVELHKLRKALGGLDIHWTLDARGPLELFVLATHGINGRNIVALKVIIGKSETRKPFNVGCVSVRRVQESTSQLLLLGCIGDLLQKH